jgi:hypothetical protein
MSAPSELAGYNDGYRPHNPGFAQYAPIRGAFGVGGEPCRVG